MNLHKTNNSCTDRRGILRNERIAKKQCCDCGADSLVGKWRCARCLEKNNESQSLNSKKLRETRKKQGLCILCGDESVDQLTRCLKCKLRLKRHSKDYRDRQRQKVMLHYSNNDIKCACCNEKESIFLSLDHVNGGSKDYKKHGSPTNLYIHLIRQNFPEGFQILCMNCNWGRSRNEGICPHQLVNTAL